MQASSLFEFPSSLPFTDTFLPDDAPWEWVAKIKEALKGYPFAEQPQGPRIPSGLHVTGEVFIDESVKLPPYGVIEGPAYIGPECELRPGVYIRGNVIVGRGCVLGNSCEFKNSLLLDEVQAPHFNYVGDSVLGNKAHLGAGVICANLRLDQKPVPVVLPDGSRVNSGLRKLGALMGDAAEAGCNSVLQPGAMLGKRAVVISMPFSGYLAPDTIASAAVRTRMIPRRE